MLIALCARQSASPVAMSLPSLPLPAPTPSAAAASASAWEFGAEFDMKEWINEQMDSAANNAAATPTSASGAATPTGASAASLSAATAHLSSLLMKLQLQTADVHNQMERQSAELVSAMPKAVREIGFIQRESQSLRASLTEILKDMATMEHAPQQTATPAATLAATAPTPASPPASASAASTIEFLQSIDVVKGRIQRCAHTLEEMDQWQQREALIDSMFSNIQLASGGNAATGETTSAAAATTSLVSASCYADLARIHRELNVMQRIVDRVRTMGLNQEHESRITSLAAYQNRLAHLTELCLDQTMELVQANSVAPSVHVGADGSLSAPDTDSSVSSDSDDLVGHLQVLHQIYSSLGKLTSFQSKYATQKIKPAFTKHVVNKYKTTAAAAPAKVSPTATAPPALSSVGQYDVSCLESWLGDFFSDVVQFTLGELAFAQQVFGVTPPPLVNAATSSSSLSDRSKFAIAADRDHSEVVLPGSASALVEAPSFDFVYSALLESLHSELIPLLSVWFNAFLGSKKSSESVQLVLQLWELSVNKLGWPLANLFFPPQAAPASAHHTHTAAPTSPVVAAPLQTALGDSSSLGFRLPHWSESAQLAQQTLLVELLYQPFLRYVEDYGTLEKKKLFASLDGMSFGGESYEQTANNIDQCHKIIVAVSTDARQRCTLFSGGVLTEPLLASLQEYYTEYIQRMFSLLRRLRRIAGLDGVISAAAKAGPSSPTAAGGDGITDLLSSSSGGASAAAAAAAAADLSSADAQWSNFQGCFQLLKVCRAMQWDLFAPHAEEAIVEQMCGQGLISVMRACEESKERTGAKSAASTKHAVALASARRNSFSAGPAPSPQSASTPAVTSAASSSPFKTPSDLSRLLFVAFLLHHPDRLKSLDSFVHRHFLPSHPQLLQSLLTPQQMQEGHQTQGLHSHPGTPMLAASPAPSSTTAAAANRAKYGFPAPGSGMLSPVSSASSSTPTGAASVTHSSHLFPSAAALFDSFISALHNLIYDVMFVRIGARLGNLHEWPVWSSTGQGKDLRVSSIPLPSFSLQPSDYMIQVGEHLLTLVQQLEPFVKGDDDDEQDGANNASGGEGTRLSMASSSPFGPSTPASTSALPSAHPAPPSYLESDALYWLNLLCKGTFKSLLGSFAQINVLSERGAKQLATDLEYLVNVLSALGLQMPNSVIKLTLWLQTNETTLAQKLTAGSTASVGVESEWNIGELSVEERRVLRQLIRCRKFTSIEKDKQLQAFLNQ